MKQLEPNLIGAYGPWAAETILPEIPRLSLRTGAYKDLDAWRAMARKRLAELLNAPATGGTPRATVQAAYELDGLRIEELSWQLPYGPATAAVFMKPTGATGHLPAVVAFHDHGGRKYFGCRKITRTRTSMHSIMAEHQQNYYGDRAWANELARRGYAVLVHDTFPFASRRVRLAEVADSIREGLADVSDRETEAEINAYQGWAGRHENIMAKSLFYAGTTWPGVFLAEDRAALDYLCSRPDVDTGRIGCGGLSGGGMRTIFLGGTDDRIRCAVCVGLMSTHRDFVLNKSHTHTWMMCVPGLAHDLDYPEILALRAPLATMVLNDSEDQLFTLPEMQRADRIMAEVFRIAGAADRYRCSFHPGPHKFDRPMQEEAFSWFDRHLRA
ncbi:MAG: hypothetical protein ABIF71_09170 [Planctomycetota bacterium]